MHYLVAVFGVFVVNWDVVLPVYASREFGGDASLYGLLVSTVGVGSFVGAMLVIRVTRISGAFFRWAGVVMTAALLVMALTPVLLLSFVGVATLGSAATAFQIFAQSRLQLEADDRLAGRVLALYSIALVGTRPIGAPIMGSIVDAAGPRVAFGFSAAAVTGLVVALQLTRVPRAPAAEDAAPATDPMTVSDADELIEPSIRPAAGGRSD